MDWRVTTVARSSLVTRCALTWSSADLASGASCSNFTSSTRSTVFSVVSTAARSLHPPRRVRGLRRERSRHPARRHRLGADGPRQVDDPRSERRRHSGARRLHPGAWRPRRMMFPSSWLSVALTARGGRRGAQPFRTVGARATGRGQRARGTSSQVCSYERTRCSTSSVRARAGQLLSVDALQRPHCGGFVRKPRMMGAIFSGLSSRTKCPASSTI